MSAGWLAFDLLLLGGILWVAWAALAPGDGFRMIVLFMVFGLLVALAWARLRAPDVALAEAAVGAGVTGALVLRTWNGLGPGRACDEPPRVRRPLRLAAAGLAAALTALLAAVLLAAPWPAAGLSEAVAARLDASGVRNPVTAVLLNFRAYDTLLEVVVLLAAAAVVWHAAGRAVPAPAPTLGPVFLGFARLALPAIVMLGGYLLWLGAVAPGGAFQAGALLAAGGIVALLGGLHRPRPRHRGPARLAIAAGTAGFAGAGALTLALDQALLQYPAGAAGTWILVIEAVLTLSIAATLAGLVYGAVPSDAPADRGDAA